MKIAIASPGQMRSDEHGVCTRFPPTVWVIDTPYVLNLYPDTIRKQIQVLLDREEEGLPEHHIFTLNRTILDMVKSVGSKDNVPLSYEDVFLFSDGKLVPLLDIRAEDWLCHFALGDLLERGEIP